MVTNLIKVDGCDYVCLTKDGKKFRIVSVFSHVGFSDLDMRAIGLSGRSSRGLSKFQAVNLAKEMDPLVDHTKKPEQLNAVRGNTWVEREPEEPPPPPPAPAPAPTQKKKPEKAEQQGLI